jgi:glycosyltransferase involved in cell wall biosynthesis
VHVAILSRYCHPFHRYGGLERMIYHHCRELEAQGVKVTLYTEPPFEAARSERIAAAVRFVPVLRIPFRYRPGQVVPDRILNYPWFSFRVGRVVADEARREQFDLVEGAGVAAFGYAWQRSRRPGLPPLVFNPPGFEEFETPDPWKYAAYSGFRALFRYAARRSVRVAAPDDCLIENTIRFTGVPRERVFVLRNGVVLEECLGAVDPVLQAELRERLGLAAASPVFLSVGRISANKGLDVLAQALAEVKDQLPPGWRWIHAGEGTARANLERLNAELGISAHVRLVGFVDERTKHSLYAMAHVFVHPTLYEGSSIVTIEALAHSLPVIASRAGGIPDKVVEGRNGWLLPPGSVRDLGAALARVARLPQAERRTLGARSREICEERFLWSRIGETLAATYAEILRAGACEAAGELDRS